MSQHVVIVDDNDLSLKLLCQIATEIAGTIVHPFRSSNEALDWCFGKDVDCFVLDQNMPPPNGVQMTWALRNVEAFALVPIIIVTGETDRKIRYSALDAGANDYILKPVDYRELLARLTTFLALRAAQRQLSMQVGSLEASLIDAEERTRRHAERLEALWQIANNPSLQDDELLLAMLRQGAAAIRSGQTFLGLIGRIDGAEVVTEAVAQLDGDGDSTAENAVIVGLRVPLEDTFTVQALNAGGTQSWNDLLTVEDREKYHAQAQGWRAVITTTFSVAGSVYGLTFGSTEPALKPFGPQDYAYVQVLASFFATHFQHRWHAERLSHQLQNDLLTDLPNRNRFRSLGRLAFRAGELAAIAVVDVDGFHRINQTYGHMIGDAVLVEVGAALAAAARDDEIVARVGGDSFGVFIPSAASRAVVAGRVVAFGAVFERPMGIGDREGKDSVPVSAVAGVALAPQDAATFDELLLCAEARTGSPDRLRFPATGP
ncbi:MAG: diguanylate cyclase [Candidatus Lustribacter sp.]